MFPKLADQGCDFYNQGAITRLGNLGGFGSVGLGINDVGEAVGYSTTPAGEFHAFLWTSSTGMIDLAVGADSHSQAVAINNKGQVAGNRCCGPMGLAATVWFRGSYTIPDTDAITDASDVNQAGMVVVINFSSDRAVVWLPPGPLLDLPHLPNSNLGQATSVNDNGVVVGIEFGPNGMARAVMWDVDGPERPPPDVPRTKDDCKRGVWRNLVRSNDTPFRNQGACVSYVNTGK